MAQMPIQMLSGRADPFSAASSIAASSAPRIAIPRAAYLYDPGGISGGKLRPGSIDQEQFKAYLAAARKEAVTAPPAPLAAPALAPATRGVPTLSPAQLAALGVDVSQLPPQHPETPSIQTPGTEAPETFATQAGQATETDAQDVPATDWSEPSASEVADAALAAVAAARPPGPAPETRERGPIPGARRGADGAWELTRRPDKDERQMLYGQKWRVVESQKSRELFLGPDGEFGWDDFLDLINPLQHIPFVNMAYRAVTGDEIYGAARMVDVAFGPLAGASTAVDLAFRDVTGESMAHNAIAAVFGPGESNMGGATPQGDPTPGDEPMADVSVNTASAIQLADAATIRRGSNK
jgi:hypothetical protein